ncbi:carbohydrate ABC transporter permease [Candidatus Poribacteria bacterium]|nr:carbohydrate ABC transporter permease [Candidatus Poribacteria bacterium]
MGNKGKKRSINTVAIIVIVISLILYLIPIYWIIATSLKRWGDIFSPTPKIFFKPTIDNYVGLMTVRSMTPEGPKIVGTSEYPRQLLNSIIIGFVSTALAVSLGTISAYAFSRFKVKGKNDLLFFILSTRMLPPVVVVIPLFLMYRALHFIDTHFGMILLYTTFNVSFATWLMKGFIDEIPKEYEEAALVDGYSRFQAFIRIVLPQAVTGIAATAVFCLITAWNEFAFALIMTQRNAITAPPSLASRMGSSGVEWGQIAAGTFLFLLPVAVFTFIMRKHLLRGVTFGAIKK